jgi:hypothetical protein
MTISFDFLRACSFHLAFDWSTVPLLVLYQYSTVVALCYPATIRAVEKLKNV